MAGITIDYTITIGNMIEAAAMIGGGLIAVIRLNTNVAKLAADVRDIQSEIKKMGDLMTKVAVQDERLNAMSALINRLDTRYDEIRHGKGLIVK